MGLRHGADAGTRRGERRDRRRDGDTAVPGHDAAPPDPLHVPLARRHVEPELRGEVLADLVAVEERHAPHAAVGEVLDEGPRDGGLAGPGQPGEQDDGPSAAAPAPARRISAADASG